MKQQVAAVGRVHQRAAGAHGSFGVDHVRQRVVINFDQFRRIFGQRARIGNHRHHPFAAVAHDIFCQRIALQMGCVYAADERFGGGMKFLTRQHIMHPRRCTCGRGADGGDACTGVR